MFIYLQLFAHKKGGGSSKNGRDSNAQRLGVKKYSVKQFLLETLLFVNVEQKFIQEPMLELVTMIHSMQRKSVLLNLKEWEKTRKKFLFFNLKKIL